MSNPKQENSTTSIWESKKSRWISDLALACFPLMPLFEGTKVAVLDKWQHLEPDPTLTIENFPDNYGIPIPAGVLVIDVDPKGYDKGDDAWIRFQADFGITPEDLDTYTVRSRVYPDGREGLHIYTSIPQGMTIRVKDKAYRGIEIKTKGQYLVGPGSIHPDTKKPYVVTNGTPEKLKPCRPAIYNFYTRAARVHQNGMEGFSDDKKTRDRFVDYLATAPEAIQGRDGDKQTYDIACVGRDFNLPEESTYDLMLACWNDRCAPPWSPGDLRAKVANAYRYAKDEPGNLHPEAAFKNFAVAAPTPELTIGDVEKESKRRIAKKDAEQVAEIQWDGMRDGNGNILKYYNTLDNVKNFFRRPHMPPDYYNALFKIIRMNTFSNRIEFTRPAPWHKPGEKVYSWRDIDTTQFRAQISNKVRWNPGKELVNDGIASYAEDNGYHPVQNYLKSLKWDGVERIGKLWTHYCGAEENIYTVATARCTMIAAIARIMQPGCQHDHVPILEGKQGTGKSTFCRILGGEWYADLHLDPHNKDTALAIQGVWIVELSEMTHTRKADADAIKSFISRTFDRLRKPYGTIMEDIPRQSICIGTMNPGSSGVYMSDQTGNRRSWPIHTGVFKNDELRRDRDQLFAEAYDMWRCGEPHWLVEADVIAYAIKEQASRTEMDAWAECVESWLDREAREGRFHERLSTMQIAAEVLNMATSSLDRRTQTRIADAMNTLGWEKAQVREKGIARKGYKNPNFCADVAEAIRGI